MTQNNKINPVFLIAGFFSANIFALELILTRLFSAVYWYHWAFLAISMGLLGGALAGLIITRLPKYFHDQRFEKNTMVMSLIYVLSLFGVLWIFCDLPSLIMLKKITDLQSNLWLLFIWFVVLSIPFFVASIIIFSVFKHKNLLPSSAYIYDLIGGLIGCLSGFYLLEYGGPIIALYSLSVLTVILSLWLAIKIKKIKTIPIHLIILIFTLFCWYSNYFQTKNIKIPSSTNIEHEYWNAISKITVSKEIISSEPFLWSKAPKRVSNNSSVNYRLIAIDDNAITPVYKYDGELKKLQFLKNDLPALAYEINSPDTAFIIGLGGGKDALTAKVYQCKNVVASEINNKIYQILKTDLINYSGKLVNDPNVRIYNQESRSYLESSDEKFDLIQASLVDSWAASHAGAYTLAENRLYTVEAWQTYFQHLTDNGALAVTRWYSPNSPQELEKLIILGKNAWQKEGIAKPQEHLVVIANPGNTGMALVMWYRQPLDKTKIANIKNITAQKGFSLVYIPHNPSNKINDLLNKDNQNLVNTDDHPFFFNLLNYRDIFSKRNYSQPVYKANFQAIINIFIILILVILIFMITNFYGRSLLKKQAISINQTNILVFALSGFGFMALETIFMQRSMSFLGHPIWSIILSLLIFIAGSVLGNMYWKKYISDSKLSSAKIIKNYLFAFVLAFVLNVILFPILAEKIAVYGWIAKICLMILFFLPVSFFVSWPFLIALNHTPSQARAYVLSLNSLAGIFGSAFIVLCSLFFGFKLSLLLILIISLLSWFEAIKLNQS